MNTEREVAILDIDGVLNNYPLDFVKWVNCEYQLQCKDLIELKKQENYREIKNHYRLSGVKRNLNTNENLNVFLEYLYENNYYIWILTSRPISGNTILDTKYWLQKKSIYYDRIDFCSKKSATIMNNLSCMDKISFMIEDDINLINNVLEIKNINNFPIILFDIHRVFNYSGDNQRIKYLNNFRQVVDLLKKGNEK